MQSQHTCPKCGSGRVRMSKTRGFAEWLRAMFGVHMMRCRSCGIRFRKRTWELSLIWYARCPKCAGLELRNWSEKYYYPPWYKQILCLVGARQQRCEACRHNFVSFRPRWNPKKKNGSK